MDKLWVPLFGFLAAAIPTIALFMQRRWSVQDTARKAASNDAERCRQIEVEAVRLYDAHIEGIQLMKVVETLIDYDPKAARLMLVSYAAKAPLPDPMRARNHNDMQEVNRP